MNEMNDRELLELAAKAAGAKQTKWIRNPSWGPDDYAFLVDFGGGLNAWVPLLDDGDALRLASALYMIVSHGPCKASASTIEGTLRGFQAYECTISQDHGKAVRRAIVRAGAEIGSRMK